MWHFYAEIGLVRHVSLHESWYTGHAQLLALLPQCGTTVRHSMTLFAADATPDRLWMCAAEGYVFKLRQVRKYEPVEPCMNEFLDIDHASREHAALGASSCYRWWNCPGSINLTNVLAEKGALTGGTSAYAQEGTDAHTLAHLCLLKGQDAIEYIDREVNGRIINDEMATAVQVYLDTCRTLQERGVECLTEKRFSLKELNPPGPMFGTADFVAIDHAAKKLTIVDLKYGKGVQVEANSPQLKYYALGTMCAFPLIPITTIEAIVVQPRGIGEAVKRITYRVSELFDWHVNLLKAAAATQDPNAPRYAGSWCRFCPCSGQCPTQAEAALHAAQAEFTADLMEGEVLPPVKLPELRLLSVEQLASMKAQFPILETFMKDVNEVLTNALHRGIQVPGWKLVAGLGDRKWAIEDETEIARDLVDKLGLKASDTHITKVISPAAAEKIAVTKLRELGLKAGEAEKMAKGVLSKMTVRPETAPKLVPESDKHPALPAPGSEFDCE